MNNILKNKIIFENISKNYFSQKDKKQILENISLEISQKEITVIIGRSGCGKTTFLRIMAGLEKADRGTIHYFDNEGKEKPAKIGMVFQEPRLMPWLTVEENIKIHEKEYKTNVKKILSLVSLQGTEKLFPHELSGGMASRTAIARAIAYNPDIFLMDEPFAALDYFTRLQLQNEIIKIHEQTKKGIVFVTHNIDEALLLGKKIIIFKNRSCEELEINGSYPRDISEKKFTDLKKEILEKLM